MQAKIGEWIVQNKAVPQNLLFPFTEVRHQRFNAHEWLVSVLFYIAIRLFGESGLPLLLGALGIALLALTVKLSSQRSEMGLGLLCGLWAMVTENYRHFLRPELLSLFLFLCYWKLLDRFALKRANSTALLACMVVLIWANSHGSFILAPLMAMCYGIGAAINLYRPRAHTDLTKMARWYDFAALAIALTLCSLANPSGWELLHFVITFSNSSVSKQMVVEWMPTFDPRLHRMLGLWIGVTTGVALAVFAVINWRRLPTADILILVLFLTLGLLFNRFLVYLGFVAAMLFPKIYALRSRQIQVAIYIATCVLGLLILGLAIRFGNTNGNYPYKSDSQETFSTPMIRTLADPKLEGTVFTSYDLGAELTYRAYPRLQASIDSRIDSYGDNYFYYHESLLEDSDRMSEFIKRYDVGYLLLTHSDFNKFQLLSLWHTGQWQIVIIDTRAALLMRKPGILNAKAQK
jgi:hypothetical protein